MRSQKILALSFVSLALVFLAGCASMDKAAVGQIKEVALVSVYADKQVDMSDFKSLGALVSKLAQNDDFNLKPMVEKFRDDLLGRYAGALGFSVMDEEVLLSSEDYQNLKNNFGLSISKAYYMAPDGYVVVHILEKKQILKVAEMLPNINGFMYGMMSFKLKKKFEIAGFGTAKVQATLFVWVKDRAGKNILYKYTFAESKDTIKFALGGVFDAKQLIPLCEQATSLAAVKFEEWVQKKMASGK